MLVRSEPGLRYRIYRPAVVVGDSRTGEMDKVDGPYYFFGILAKLARLPSFTPVLLPDTGRTNIVPVDYVVDASDRTDPCPRPRRPDVPPHRTRQHRPARHLPRRFAGGGAAAAAGFAAARRSDAVPSSDRTRQGAAQYGGDAIGHPRRDPRRRRPDADIHRRQHAGSVAGHRDNGPGVRVVRAEAVAVLGRAPRPRPGAATTTRPARWSASTSSSPARPAASAAPRRSRWPNAARRFSRWPATPKRSMTWSPRSARQAARRTRSPATSPTARRWSTPSRTSSAGSTTSTIWSTTRAARSAGRSRPPPTGCTTTSG